MESKKNSRLTTWLFRLSPVLLLGLLWCVYWFPRHHADQIVTVIKNDQDRAAWFEVENKARTTLLQGLGGAFFLVTAYFAWRNLQVAERNHATAEENRRIAEDNRKLTEQKNVSERITQAVKMLSDAEKEDSLDLRLGAIYALARVAKDSPDDHWPIAELLCAYVRRRSPTVLTENAQGRVAKMPSEDVKAALRVILSKHPPEGNSVYLKTTRLCFTSLVRSELIHAQLMDATLAFADLTSANLTEATLQTANLYNATLENATLTKANLIGADLRAAKLKNADLEGAVVSLANFREAQDLTVDQIKAARDWKNAVYDLDFAAKLGLNVDTQIKRTKEWDATYAKVVSFYFPEKDEIRKTANQVFEKYGLRHNEKEKKQNDPGLEA